MTFKFKGTIMKLPNSLFVVAVIEDGEVKRYYDVDRDSGPYFSSQLKYAKIFDDGNVAIEVVKELNIKANTPQQPRSGGTLYPHSDIHRALELYDKKKKAEGMAVVLELTPTVGYGARIHGEIKEPTGYTYD